MATYTRENSTIINGAVNPMYSHTLSDFINASNDRSSVPTFDSFCFEQRSGNIIYSVKNTIDDYMYELKNIAIKVKLTDEQLHKYNYNPKLLCADIYKVTDLYYIILLLNGICSVKEFHDINPIKMLRIDDMNTYLSKILNGESANIKAYNSRYL